MSIAVIDIGSNAIRLCAYAVDRDKADTSPFTQLFRERVAVGLASYIDSGNVLMQQGIDATIDTLCRLRTILDNTGVNEAYVIATASLRNISNSEQAVRAIEEGTGFKIDILSAEEEALFGFTSFRMDYNIPYGVLCDIGGGSSEVVTYKGDTTQMSISVPIGALKLFRLHVERILPSSSEVAAMRRVIAAELDNAGLLNTRHYSTLCGIGGTCNAAKALVNRYFDLSTSNSEFTTRQLDQLLAMLCSDSRAARDLFIHTCPDRMHMVIPGLLILRAIATRYGVSVIHVSMSGVREGYLVKRVLGNLQNS